MGCLLLVSETSTVSDQPFRDVIYCGLQMDPDGSDTSLHGHKQSATRITFSIRSKGDDPPDSLVCVPLYGCDTIRKGIVHAMCMLCCVLEGFRRE